MEEVFVIAAAVDLAEAAERDWDAIVAGAGPAGALVSRELGRRGARVLLVDKAAFPRTKVCGGCLNQRALAVLGRTGLGPAVRAIRAVPLGVMCLAAGGRQCRIALGGTRAVSRDVFDAALVREAVRAEVTFLPETTATVLPVGGELRPVRLRRGRTERVARARVALAADGLGGKAWGGGPVRADEGSRLGAGAVVEAPSADYAAGTVYMACGRGGYVGLVRVAEGRLEVAAAFDPAYVRRAGGLGGAARRIVDGAGLPAVPGLERATWRGTPLLTRKRRHVAAERVFAVGDAAGYVEPFTGEGISWALETGEAVTPLALRAIRGWRAELAAEWEALYRSLVGRRQRACRLVAGVLRHPSLVRAILALVGRAPWLARPVLAMTNHTDLPAHGDERARGAMR